MSSTTPVSASTAPPSTPFYPPQVDVIHRKMQSARIFVLNRPKQLNALNLDMIYNMTPQLQAWQESDLCNVIILMPYEGSKAFCAGGDVKAIVTQAMSGEPEDVAAALKFFEEEYKLNHLIGTCKKPFISIMDGITMGGGVGLSVHAPFRIATENTLFAMPETAIGLFPDVGGSFFLPRLDGEIGTYLGLTGHRLKGEEVFMAGVATHFVPSVRLPALLNRLAELDTDELEVVNSTIEEFVGDPDLGMEKWSSWSMGGKVREAIDRCFKYDTIEEIIAALEKENTEWSAKTLKTLKKMSPTSLKVTLMQLRRGKQKHFADCFKMEYNLARAFLRTPDFYEGVRATLIDKTGKPQWTPSWEEMTEKLTKNVLEKIYFEPPSPSSSSPLLSGNLRLLNPLTYYDYPHRTLSGLPTDEDVRRVMNGSAQRGRTILPPDTKEEIIDWLHINWGSYDTGIIGTQGNVGGGGFRKVSVEGGFGRGKVGLVEKVSDILERRCKKVVKEDGKLVYVWRE